MDGGGALHGEKGAAGKGKGKAKEIWQDIEVDDGNNYIASSSAALIDLNIPLCDQDVINLEEQQLLPTRRRDKSLLDHTLPEPEHKDDRNNGLLTPDHQKVTTNVEAGDINNLEVEAQFPIPTTKEPTFMELLLGDKEYPLPPYDPNDTDYCYAPTRKELPKMTLQGNDGTETTKLEPPVQISNPENIVSGSGAGSGPQFSVVPAEVEQDPRMTVLNNNDAGGLLVQSPTSSLSSSGSCPGYFAELMEVHRAHGCAWLDQDQGIPLNPISQFSEALMNHYALDVEMSYSGRHPERSISGCAQAHHSGGSQVNIRHSSSVLNNRNAEFLFLLHLIKHPMNNSIRLIHIKGHVPAFSADPFGSRFIQEKLETAITGEIIMLYKETMPHLRTLVNDIFANYAIQKLLEHGPPHYRKKLVSKLSRNVLGISLHMYGCRVIQKAFEISNLDLKLELAKEIGNNLLKCVVDQNANHVVQKCLECVPGQWIKFIYRSFCGKTKMLSCHPHGCRVIQKVLQCCDDPEIQNLLISEITEDIGELAADQYGNYVVQYMLEHFGPYMRLIILMKFAGRIAQMSCQKYSSNVIEKCLTLGSYEDRQLIANEIIFFGLTGGTMEHLLGMMISQYASYVIQKLLDTAGEWQRNLIINVVCHKTGTLMKYTHGRHVVAYVYGILRQLAIRASPATEQPWARYRGLGN